MTEDTVPHSSRCRSVGSRSFHCTPRTGDCVTVYDAFPVSKDTKVLNVYNIFNLQKRHCE